MAAATITAAAAVASAGAGIYSASKAGKGGGGGGVSVNAADAAARRYAEKNIKDAIRLEQQYSPETFALRQQSTQALLDEAGRPTNTAELQASLMDRYRQGFAPSALSQAAYDRAQAELALGGQLDRETQNAVTRAALSRTAGTTGNLGLGRDVSARDLGLASMAVQQQRLNQAQQFGQAYDQNLLAQLQAQQGLAGSVNDLGQSELSRRLALAQFGQSIARPESGLTPDSVVNLMVGNSNARQAAAANKANNQAAFGNSLLTLGGQLGGAALGAYMSRPVTQPTPSPSPAPAPSAPASSQFNGVFNGGGFGGTTASFGL
jgi:hypothetical protein